VIYNICNFLRQLFVKEREKRLKTRNDIVIEERKVMAGRDEMRSIFSYNGREREKM
jgi:lipoate-protein ligase A